MDQVDSPTKTISEGQPPQEQNLQHLENQDEYEDIPEEEYQQLVKAMEEKKAKD